MRLIKTIETTTFDTGICEDATSSLEKGSVVYLPKLPFALGEEEALLLSPEFVKPGVKNISYNALTKDLRGMKASHDVEERMVEMMQRYVDFSKKLIDSLFPHYKGHYELGKTSYRPVEIQGRESSYRKDDTRLHVDAFPSNPNQGKRILRVFSNINPHNKPRHWRIGEPFTNVAESFLPQISTPIKGKHFLLKTMGITKTLRSDYDHYMLKMHNRMKADSKYQKEVSQEAFDFIPGTSWIVFTDLVSHAAMTGQYVMEQTFYLDVADMKCPDHAPIRILESMLRRKLA